MFIDDIKNRYTYLNSMKNVVHEEPTEDEARADRTIIIAEALEPVLGKLVKKRPTWRFKATDQLSGASGVHALNTFEIYEGDEPLGRLWTEWHWSTGAIRFYFSNFRVDAARVRSKSAFTTKPEEAVKRIVKAFHLKTPSERAADTFRTVGGTVHKAWADAEWPLRRAEDEVRKALLDYAYKHWDEIKTLASLEPTLDLPALRQHQNEAVDLKNAFSASDGGGVTVRIEANSSYSVSRKTNTGFAVETYNDSTLPDHLRGSLGLLKMVDNGNLIPGVGVRSDANHYFVIDKKGD